MAELRLTKLIRTFNIGLDTLVNFLNSKGADIDIENVNPNMKVSDSFLPELQKKFGRDKAIKDTVNQEGFLESEMFRRLGNVKLNPSSEFQSQSTSHKASIVPEEFDWDAFENEGTVIEANEIQHIPTLTKNVDNEIVEGVVTSINKREVVVNIGARSEGVISAAEFRYNPNLKVGDKVDVYVESTEDRRGMLLISHKKARQLKAWDKVNEAYESGYIVKGYVKSCTKGGMLVDVFGVEAFLPGSQIDTKPIRDYDFFVDTTMDFKIVKINQEFRNVVVSHKAVIEDEVNRKRAAFFSQLKKGQILDGKVKSIVDYGVFVDLGIVDGLIHINNLSSGPSKSPKEVVSVGENIKVTVIDFDKDIQRISLGLKQDEETLQATSPRTTKTNSDGFSPESIFNAKALEMLRKQNKN